MQDVGTDRPDSAAASRWSLLCRVDERLCALPLASVVETTRPLPIEPVTGAPAFVLGLSIVRGTAVPVVDAERLLGGQRSTPSRFVMLRVGKRFVALAVDGVVGVRQLGAASLQELPPLLRNADAAVVSNIGTLDSELLVVLQAIRIVPEAFFVAIEAEALAS
jgi:purine-binding chemotaxis protein CheW